MTLNNSIRRHLVENLGPLFHVTSVKAWQQFAFGGVFELGYAGKSAETRFHSDRYWYMSLSRVRANRFRLGSGGVTLVVDGDKLRQSYRIRPVDYWGSLQGPTGPDSESEERLVSDKPAIEKFNRFILETHILYTPHSDEIGLYDTLQYLDDPSVFIYSDRKAYFLMDKRRSKDPARFFKETPRAEPKVHPHSNYSESRHQRIGELLDFLESKGTRRGTEWYDRFRYYYRDFVAQVAADFHNYHTERSYASRMNMQRYDRLRRQYGATSYSDFAQKFLEANR